MNNQNETEGYRLTKLINIKNALSDLIAEISHTRGTCRAVDELDDAMLHIEQAIEAL